MRWPAAEAEFTAPPVVESSVQESGTSGGLHDSGARGSLTFTDVQTPLL